MCSNDYMGLARKGREWFGEFIERFGVPPMTSSASRLLASDQEAYEMLENYLAEAYGREALLFNSGYHANVGLISALNIPGTLWLTDKLIHASAIDGIRMAKAEFKRWNHNDIAMLRRILEKEHDSYDRLIVVCESIYSMDGDKAPIAEICRLREQFPKMLVYVDEAHAVGCTGPKGLGECAALGLVPQVDFLVGTLGKAVASSGAFVVTTPEMKRYLVNTARSLIFSTALPPANALWSLFMLEKLAGMDAGRRRLQELSAKFKRTVEDITAMPNPSDSAIVPLITGDAAKVVEISRRLEEDGILALPIRRPTVPPGGERIRFSLHASLTDRELERIENVLREIVS